MEEKRFDGEMGLQYDDELILRVFSHHAGFYEAFQDEIRGRLIPCMGTNRYRVLEGGCGTGYSTEIILEAVRNMDLISVDNEPLMLEKARQRLRKTLDPAFAGRGLPSLELVESDLLAYLRAQPDSSLDAFVSAFTLHNTLPEYRAQVVVETYRVLKPWGFYLNADRCARANLVEHFVDLSSQFSALSAYLALGRPDQYELWFAHILRDENWRFTETEQRDLLVSAGFDPKQMLMLGRWQTECIFVATKRT